jgi:hypothetical protein
MDALIPPLQSSMGMFTDTFIQIAIVLGLLVVAALIVRAAANRYSDARNIDRLCERYGCSREDGALLYLRSREVGFGAAYREIFGTRIITPNVRPAPRPTNQAATKHSAND